MEPWVEQLARKTNRRDWKSDGNGIAVLETKMHDGSILGIQVTCTTVSYNHSAQQFSLRPIGQPKTLSAYAFMCSGIMHSINASYREIEETVRTAEHMSPMDPVNLLSYVLDSLLTKGAVITSKDVLLDPARFASMKNNEITRMFPSFIVAAIARNLALSAIGG